VKLSIHVRGKLLAEEDLILCKTDKDAPFPYNPKLRLWTGKLPANEVDDLVLATGMNLDPQGYLSRETAAIAAQLNIGYDSTKTIEDEEAQLEQLRFANCLFTYSECALCECSRCARLLSGRGERATNGTNKRTRPS
jgi:hypothetical protein